MSASPVARQATSCQYIPSRKVVLNDASQLPVDYSSTPGGTLYSTTPGGTRIVYEKNFMMNLRNSPISCTPPKNLSSFPSSLMKNSPNSSKPEPAQSSNKVESTIEEVPEQFDMDI